MKKLKFGDHYIEVSDTKRFWKLFADVSDLEILNSEGFDHLKMEQVQAELLALTNLKTGVFCYNEYGEYAIRGLTFD